jgi:hypothetical protein
LIEALLSWKKSQFGGDGQDFFKVNVAMFQFQIFQNWLNKNSIKYVLEPLPIGERPIS